MTTYEMQELMGSQTSEAEAAAMIEIFAERGITDDMFSEMDDNAFFALIPDAIARTNANPRRSLPCAFFA